MVGAGNAVLARDDLSRRERRKREVRDRMLAASTTLFEEKGFGPTTVAEICARADVAHKTFFNHFPSKQHLLRAVARVQLEELVALVEAARHDGRSTRERLTRFFQLLAARIDAAGPMRRELVTEMIHVAYEGGGQQTQARTLRRAFGALVRDGLAEGDVTRDHGVETLTEVVVGAFYALMFNWANFARYPFRARALAAARFLGDALSTGRRRR